MIVSSQVGKISIELWKFIPNFGRFTEKRVTPLKSTRSQIHLKSNQAKNKIWNIHLWRKNVSVDWNWSCRYKIGVVLALTRAWWKNVKKKPRWKPLMKRFTCKVEIIQKLLYLEKENFHRYQKFVIMIINTMMMMFIIIKIMKAFWSFIWADW